MNGPKQSFPNQVFKVSSYILWVWLLTSSPHLFHAQNVSSLAVQRFHVQHEIFQLCQYYYKTNWFVSIQSVFAEAFKPFHVEVCCFMLLLNLTSF